MIIDNFYAFRAAGVFRPFKANTPLHVNSDRVLSFSLPLKSFKAIRGQRGKIRKACRRLKDAKSFLGLLTKDFPFSDSLARGEAFRVFRPIAPNHISNVLLVTYCVNMDLLLSALLLCATYSVTDSCYTSRSMRR